MRGRSKRHVLPAGCAPKLEQMPRPARHRTLPIHSKKVNQTSPTEVVQTRLFFRSDTLLGLLGELPVTARGLALKTKHHPGNDESAFFISHDLQAWHQGFLLEGGECQWTCYVNPWPNALLQRLLREESARQDRTHLLGQKHGSKSIKNPFGPPPLCSGAMPFRIPPGHQLHRVQYVIGAQSLFSPAAI